MAKVWTFIFYCSENNNLSSFCVIISEKEKKWGKHMQHAESLAEELQKYSCLCEKGN